MTGFKVLYATLAGSALGATNTTSFVSNDGLYCAEGSPREAESALAMKKASPLGALFSESFGRTGVACEERGFKYTFGDGSDSCVFGVGVRYKSMEAISEFQKAHDNTLRAYGATYALDDDLAHLMNKCTCQPNTPDFDAAGDACAAFDDKPGCWVHMDPYTGDELICDQGPFVFATRALSVLKGSPQLAMHFRDPVRAVDCASLGFGVKLDVEDHCYPGVVGADGKERTLNVWTRTSLTGPQGCDGDWGCHQSVAVESNLTKGGGFGPWATAQGLDAGEIEILTNELGCNCLAYSEVREKEMGDWCDSHPHSPVRDWWDPQTAAKESVV